MSQYWTDLPEHSEMLQYLIESIPPKETGKYITVKGLAMATDLSIQSVRKYLEMIKEKIIKVKVGRRIYIQMS